MFCPSDILSLPGWDAAFSGSGEGWDPNVLLASSRGEMDTPGKALSDFTFSGCLPSLGPSSVLCHSAVSPVSLELLQSSC